MKMSPAVEPLFIDPALPQLGVVTDSVAMAEIFAHNLRPTLAELSSRVESCAIDWLQHRRGRRCRLLYRLVMQDDRGESVNHWFFAKLVRSGQAVRQFEEAQSSAPLPNGKWPAVSLWPELEMVVWAYPNDPDIPHLVQVADPCIVQTQINKNLTAFGLSEAWKAEYVVVEPVKYMPGKRCVLRYRAEMINGSGQSHRLSFYGKTYSDGRSRLHHRNLQEIKVRLRDLINIPRPILHWDEASTFWQEAWEGQPLMDGLAELEWKNLFVRLADLLAEFHQSRCEGLPLINTIERCLDAAHEDGMSLQRLLPANRESLSEVLTALQDSTDYLSRAGFPVVPVHGTMRLEQILTNGVDLALVDFDAATLGDPLYDVAEFLVSLQYLEFARGFSPTQIDEPIPNGHKPPRPLVWTPQVVNVHTGFGKQTARAATSNGAHIDEAVAVFLERYASRVPWKVSPKRVAWYACVILLNKVHESLRSLDRCALQNLDAILELLKERRDEMAVTR